MTGIPATKEGRSRIARRAVERWLRRDWEKILSAVTTCDGAQRTLSVGDARLCLAIAAAEDHRFFQHHGVDYRSVVRAALQLALAGRLSGASTIEQQLVRVLRGRYEVTLRRKLSEMLLATALNGTLEKLQSVQMYATVAYFGWHGSGVDEACRRFNWQRSKLTMDQAVMLAAMLKRPMPRQPSERYVNLLERRRQYIQGRLSQVARGADRELVERACMRGLPKG